MPLIGSTFEKVVFDPSKAVLVEFYDPSCDLCKKFEPEYEKLAEGINKHVKRKNLLLAKIDSTANDVPVEIDGFPTLYMFPQGKDVQPIKYEGDRNFGGLIEFIDEYSRSVKPDVKDEI